MSVNLTVINDAREEADQAAQRRQTDVRKEAARKAQRARAVELDDARHFADRTRQAERRLIRRAQVMPSLVSTTSAELEPREQANAFMQEALHLGAGLSELRLERDGPEAAVLHAPPTDTIEAAAEAAAGERHALHHTGRDPAKVEHRSTADARGVAGAEGNDAGRSRPPILEAALEEIGSLRQEIAEFGARRVATRSDAASRQAAPAGAVFPDAAEAAAGSSAERIEPQTAERRAGATTAQTRSQAAIDALVPASARAQVPAFAPAAPAASTNETAGGRFGMSSQMADSATARDRAAIAMPPRGEAAALTPAALRKTEGIAALPLNPADAIEAPAMSKDSLQQERANRADAMRAMPDSNGVGASKPTPGMDAADADLPGARSGTGAALAARLDFIEAYYVDAIEATKDADELAEALASARRELEDADEIALGVLETNLVNPMLSPSAMPTLVEGAVAPELQDAAEAVTLRASKLEHVVDMAVNGVALGIPSPALMQQIALYMQGAPRPSASVQAAAGGLSTQRVAAGPIKADLAKAACIALQEAHAALSPDDERRLLLEPLLCAPESGRSESGHAAGRTGSTSGESATAERIVVQKESIDRKLADDSAPLVALRSI
ncbi:MAG: hypothetical protein EOO24_02560 [Comamonadaceae bacterium]|nr:MAG: hypothetical protein EOO24_02560 [Comamonadaceae bacterium]